MILLLDSSTPVCRLTLISHEGDWHEAEWQADRTLATGLLNYLQTELRERGCELTDLTGIGVFRGPGSFTGLRIGMTVLNTLADALQIPIIGSIGESWKQDAVERLSAGHNDRVVLPHYGSDAHITAPRK